MFNILKLKLGHKIISIAFVGFFGFLINLTFSYFVSVENQQRLNEVENIYFPILEYTDKNIVLLEKINQKFTDAAGMGEMVYLEEAKKLRDLLEKNHDYIIPLLNNGTVKSSDYINTFQEFYSIASKVTKNIINETADFSILQTQLKKVAELYSSTQKSIKSFRDKNKTHFKDSIFQAKESSHHAFITSIIVSFIASIILIMFGLGITKSIITNVNKMNQSLVEIANGEGDLTQRLKVSGYDEITYLSQAFNKFLEKLQSILSDITASSKQLNIASSEMQETSCNNQGDCIKKSLTQIP